MGGIRGPKKTEGCPGSKTLAWSSRFPSGSENEVEESEIVIEMGKTGRPEKVSRSPSPLEIFSQNA